MRDQDTAKLETAVGRVIVSAAVGAVVIAALLVWLL